MRILIVEDEDRMAKTIQSLLKKQNYISDIASDGEEGLDCILSGIYDLVILDVMLPKMDGFQVLEAIRARGVNVPVLLLTARSTVTDRIEGLDKGADYYLPKPFASGELLACIRALLRRPRELDTDALTFADLSLDEEGGRGGRRSDLRRRKGLTQQPRAGAHAHPHAQRGHAGLPGEPAREGVGL